MASEIARSVLRMGDMLLDNIAEAIAKADGQLCTN